jgi:predicted nuclease of predicted toxin-antitoxin system
MRFLIDENLCDRSLESRLRAQGHDPILAIDVGLRSVADPRVLIWAIGQGLPVLTQDSKDFEALHDLVMAAGGHYPGLLIVRVDRDPRHNMTDRAIDTTISKLEAAGVPIPDHIHVLNHWR